MGTPGANCRGRALLYLLSERRSKGITNKSRTGQAEIPARVTDWLAALEARHLADLRVPEVTRALRALSSAYVERRDRSAEAGVRRVGATLDTSGKRAAFALYYGPLHFLALTAVIDALGAATPAPRQIVDLGCGTGVAGAAWALAAGGGASLTGIDRHPWAVAESRWTYERLGLHGRTRPGDIARLPHLGRGDAIVAAYTLNELSERDRTTLEDRLFEASSRGARLLLVEPISRRVAPWWDGLAARAAAAGGRGDEWKFEADLPPLVERFDRAAGLDHRVIACRSIYCP
jgi:SAM-dependent methyltransferase